MRIGSAEIQLILDLYATGKLKNYNNVIEIGSQEFHLKSIFK